MARTVGAAGSSRQELWRCSIFGAKGQFLTSSDTKLTSDTVEPPVGSDVDQVIRQDKQKISPVYYSPQDQHAFVYIYTPVTWKIQLRRRRRWSVSRAGRCALTISGI